MDLARSNRWFGGTWAMRYALDKVLGRGSGKRVTLLDLGTGAGDLPAAARRWGHSNGWDVVPLGLERIPAAAVVAREGGLPVVVGCASGLPFRPGSVDLVLLSQVLHHFRRDSAAETVRACNAIARRGVVILDLARSTLAEAAFRVGARVMGFSRITIDDGITSLRRGFTTSEMSEVLAAAGVDVPVLRRPGSRLVACWRKESDADA